MNEIQKYEGQPVIDSRQVAEMVGKQHKHLMRDIQKYSNDILTSPNLDPLSFFIQSEYTDQKGETRPCYLLTKQGCEFVANKMTGRKGNIFTAEYVSLFNQMESKQIDSYMISDPVKRAERWIEEHNELTQERKGRLIAEQRNLELQPKADYCDAILSNKELVTITQIAKDYGMSGSKMNQLLHQLGVQYKQSGTWLLYARYQTKGWTQSETTPITHRDGRLDVKMTTKWTQKGRLGLYELLKQHDVLPLIEK